MRRFPYFAATFMFIFSMTFVSAYAVLSTTIYGDPTLIMADIDEPSCTTDDDCGCTDDCLDEAD